MTPQQLQSLLCQLADFDRRLRRVERFQWIATGGITLFVFLASQKVIELG